jgi:hypothetical protein
VCLRGVDRDKFTACVHPPYAFMVYTGQLYLTLRLLKIYLEVLSVSRVDLYEAKRNLFLREKRQAKGDKPCSYLILLICTSSLLFLFNCSPFFINVTTA